MTLGWLTVATAASVGMFVALFLSVIVTYYTSFPKDLAKPTCSFLIGLFTVFAGSWFAPRHRFLTAVVLVLLATPVGVFLPASLPWTIAGSLTSGALLAWWFHPRWTTRSMAWGGTITGVGCVAFAGLVYARYVDWPPRSEALPPELSEVLGTNAARVGAFYRYDLGGFLDHEWLWRFETEADVVNLVVRRLNLQPTNNVPAEFWRMPPFYWPRSRPESAEAFQSIGFDASGRGPDGLHYSLLHDMERRVAFVWFKFNF